MTVILGLSGALNHDPSAALLIDGEVVAAAEAAHADHFIRTQPEGYDLVLNEETSNLSQGQKQLLTIARAILADPRILIMDEATSSVDTETEQHIQSGLTELFKGRISLVIAHRLSTIRNADRIIVIEHGRITEEGSHAELMALGGRYCTLYTQQSLSEFANEEKIWKG